MIFLRSPLHCHISTTHFKKINWLPVELRVELCTATIFQRYHPISTKPLNLLLIDTTLGHR